MTSPNPESQIQREERRPWPDPAGARTVFDLVTSHALSVGERQPTFVGGLLLMLHDLYVPEEHPEGLLASPSEAALRAVATEAGLDATESQLWVLLAKGLALSERHVGHILNSLRAFDRGVKETLTVLGEARRRGIDPLSWDELGKGGDE